MKNKIIIVCILLVVFVIVLRILEPKKEKNSEAVTEVQIDLSAVESKIYLNKNKLMAALNEYLSENEIRCQTATAIDFRYEDLQTADIVYDVYFRLDDRDKTLLTIRYQPTPNSTKVSIKIKLCEYSYDEIKSKAWYREDYQ